MSQSRRASDSSEAGTNSLPKALLIIAGIALLFVAVGMIFASAGSAHVAASQAGNRLVQDNVDPIVAISRISWGAILAGALVALMLQLALNLLGISVGAATLAPELQRGVDLSEEPKSVGIGLAAWTALSVLISLFVGGWIAGRLAGFPTGTDGMLHGIVTWSVVTLLSIALLATGVGRVVSGGCGHIPSTVDDPHTL